jgi:hypothetical protein
MSISSDITTASTGTLFQIRLTIGACLDFCAEAGSVGFGFDQREQMAEKEQPIMQSFFNPSSIFAWTLPRHFPESKAKGACLRIPDSQTDISDRQPATHTSQLGRRKPRDRRQPLTAVSLVIENEKM